MSERPKIKADIRGKLVYDPRDGEYKVSNNPALIILDILRHEPERLGFDGKVPIDDEAFARAADFLDGRVGGEEPGADADE